MAFGALGSLGSTGKIWLGAAGAAAVAVIGGVYVNGGFAPEPPVSAPVAEQREAATPDMGGAPEEPATPTDPAPDTAAQVVPQIASEIPPALEAPEGGSADKAAPEGLPPLMPPGFDIVRANPDGSTLVAGTGPVGAEVRVLVDGAPGGRGIVDGSGGFVVFLTLETGPDPRVLTLEAEQDGQVVQSDAQIILAPVAEPVAEPGTAPVAEAVSEPVAEPDTEGRLAAGPDAAAPEPEAPGAAGHEGSAPEPEAPPADRADVAVLRADADGVELVQPAAQAPDVDDIALDTISYSPAGAVQISGRAAPSARETLIRVYLDNQLVSDLTADPDGRWRGVIEGIEPGVYTLRLDAVDPAGQVVSRLETPFKREDPLALSAARGDAPEDGAAIRAVTVQAGDTLWALSQARYGDGVLFVKLFEANRDQIRDPNLIYPGQVFELPQ
ncbi:MAG: LysM peptidoglycan-binding domain-containing protein [Marinibacterium sp.]|nr:LysM peptidoglycan-binding domain-containing protein [Marinibacterium sp.]